MDEVTLTIKREFNELEVVNAITHFVLDLEAMGQSTRAADWLLDVLAPILREESPQPDAETITAWMDDGGRSQAQAR